MDNLRTVATATEFNEGRLAALFLSDPTRANARSQFIESGEVFVVLLGGFLRCGSLASLGRARAISVI